ncbi:hypothetical protein N7516_004275 [Penicillium verrucosum]|uniref:uncharacterized protein n=1 Tax=Penicillium verrucosum TaxID=60171 RepID=UPI0025454C01|nr:uncharacterized protein N7516_004275 [Penicillium verrucosum]KAJ5944107.1 hypothetical protein N7516_004275 [Penicillium verrucosum]
MPGLIRPHIQQLSSPISKKQRVSAKESSIFPYPAVPSECIDHHEDLIPDAIEMFREMVEIPKTNSSEWGNKEAAAARALLEPNVTNANQQLIRTHHPSLSHLHLVWMVQESKDKGLEIHVQPWGHVERTTVVWPKLQPDPLNNILNPRKFLSQDDLHLLREMFPCALGIRVFISGFIVILFKSRSDIEYSWLHDGFSDSFGCLRLRYDILQDEPTRNVIPRGAAITTRPDCIDGYAALGLKLRFPSGQEAITVPTHAFVTLRSMLPMPLLCVSDWYQKIKTKMALYLPIRRNSSIPAVGTARHQAAGNSPLGKNVFLVGESQHIGTISFTYDPVSLRPLRFPMGFTHDLSLITNDRGLPQMVTPNHTPQVSGWGAYKDVLDGNPVFVTGFNVSTGNQIRRIGTGISRRAHQAIVEGSQYFWDKELLSQSVSILWRTQNDQDSLQGLSGTALCLGLVSDKTCLAVCFQNFESPLRSQASLNEDHRGTPSHEYPGIRIKGGFLLPPEMRECQILCDAPETPAGSATYPSRERATAGLRRSFSSHR